MVYIGTHVKIARSSSMYLLLVFIYQEGFSRELMFFFCGPNTEYAI